jgi:hypothetical protein
MAPVLTNKLVVMIQRTEKGCRLETAYPGMLVTDLPQPAIQTPAELVFTTKAWERLAFINLE